ncbi:MAG: hypothetical protein IPP29_11680 [Bacteroidetes bacterium]|nr:hypothetical protein [Bacteroidota bacterium]
MHNTSITKPLTTSLQPGSFIVNVASSVQPFASVTVPVYVLAVSLLWSSSVLPSFQTYV